MKKLLCLIAVLCCTGLSAQNIVDKCFPEDQIFALGSYYYPEQWDESQWDRDLKKMADMGINFTHFAEFAWAMMEPEEGQYEFEWLDRAVALAEKHGLKVIMCTPTPCPPVWMSKKYPDILIKRDNGVVIEHSRRQHASWSSDRYCEYVRKIVTQLAKRYGNNPTVIGWQIDNEPSHYGVTDYSDNAQAKFRLWLKQKYGTVEAMNDTWGNAFWSETYQNFDQVRLPNPVEMSAKANPHAMLDMNNFMSDEVARFVNLQADILHQYCKNQWVTTNCMPMHSPVDPARMSSLDFLTYTRYLIIGGNGIGEQGFRLGVPVDLGFSNDQFRNYTGKTFGVMELQPGQVNWGTYNAQPMPGAVRMWAYHILAGGAKFVCNYRFRQPLKGSEQHHYGMINTDGVTLTAGGREYVQMAKELKILRENYDKSAVMPSEMANRRIAILFDMNSYFDTNFQPQTDQWNTLNHIHKYHNVLTRFAAPIDVISDDADFSQYPFMLVPAYQLVDKKLVDRWTEYANNGGHLIITCRTGLKDRNAMLWEAPFAQPIHDLTGMDEVFFDHMPKNLYGKVSFNGASYDWNNWADVITPKSDTDVWATYTDQFYKGSAAVLHRKLGKGTVTYIGVDSDDWRLEEDVLRRVYAQAGVTTESLPFGLIKLWRDGFYFVMNYTSEEQKVDIPSDAEILIGERNLQPAGVVVWK